MVKRIEFVPYRPKTILNKSKRAEHWFWTRYTAYPYKGCQHGCEFCYCREEKYYPYEDPRDFAYRIQVKENAPELLRRALSRAPVDLVRIDAIYNPVRRANFTVEETRVGQRTDFDRLTLHVETDGSVDPEAAIRYAAELVRKHPQNIYVYFFAV